MTRMRPSARAPSRSRRCSLLVGLLLAAACGEKSKGNHTVQVTNAGRAASASVCAAREFRWISVASAAGNFAYSSNIVVTVGQTTDVPLDLPADGAYRLQLGAWVPKSAGEAVWFVEWSGLPMAIGATTVVHLETDDNGYRARSTADGLPPQVDVVACTNP
jgi:hypothetical protein